MSHVLHLTSIKRDTNTMSAVGRDCSSWELVEIWDGKEYDVEMSADGVLMMASGCCFFFFAFWELYPIHNEEVV
jgi:hypothetical protein